ncbi:hypothetical protein [Mesobacillus zeae]|uniref:Uncharacterized protein n=1 Tax=Mesobacillus zeae TaxID=1917180 RepID=A0A398AX69_9BACI|nr:hypothetical protein [Mesobacillus zeae]RID82247.1 hypothetical protein D1970_19650 [Mesobacillus zeae]
MWKWAAQQVWAALFWFDNLPALLWFQAGQPIKEIFLNSLCENCISVRLKIRMIGKTVVKWEGRQDQMLGG